MRTIEFTLDGRKHVVPWRDSKRAVVYAAERGLIDRSKRVGLFALNTLLTAVIARDPRFAALCARFGHKEPPFVRLIAGKSNRGRGSCVFQLTLKSGRRAADIFLTRREGDRQHTVAYFLHELAHAVAYSGRHHWPWRLAFIELLKLYSDHPGDYLEVQREYTVRGLDFGENTVRMHPSDFEEVRS